MKIHSKGPVTILIAQVSYGLKAFHGEHPIALTGKPFALIHHPSGSSVQSRLGQGLNLQLPGPGRHFWHGLADMSDPICQGM